MTGHAVTWMRHGTCADGLLRPGAHARPDSPLAVRGQSEVAFTARKLAESRRQPVLILCSPLRRAVNSAWIVARTLGDCPVLPPDPLLAEWAAPDCVLGRFPEQYPPEYVDWQRIREADPESSLPGGESLAALLDRAARARARAHEIAAQQGHVLAISHRVLIGIVAALAAHVTDPALAFQRARRFNLPPAAAWSDRPGHP